MAKSSSSKKKEREVTEFQTVDEFIEYQLSEYIKIHKRHEKEINYIG